MGLSPGIPLAIRPPSEPEGPMQMQQGAMQLSALAQQQQIRNQQLQAGEIQLQQARQTQAEEQGMMQLMKENQGDLDQVYQKAVASGKYRPQTIQALQLHRLDYKTKLAAETEANLKIEQDVGTQFAGALDVAKGVPVERRKEVLDQQIAKIASTGADVSSTVKTLQGLPDLSDQTLDNVMPMLIGHNKSVADEIAKRNVAREELTAKAAMTRAETDKLPTEASLALASAQGDKDAEAALKRLDQSRLASRPPKEPKDTTAAENTRSDRSYQYNSTQLERVAQPIDALAARLGRLQDTIAQNSPQADALVAPELMTVMAGGQGSGLRMNEAEIARIVGGRSNWETLKASANKWQLDPQSALSITPAQRKQIRDLTQTVAVKISAKQQAIQDARDSLINTTDPDEHKRIVANARGKMTKIDVGEGAGEGATTPPPGAKVRDYTNLGNP